MAGPGGGAVPRGAQHPDKARETPDRGALRTVPTVAEPHYVRTSKSSFVVFILAHNDGWQPRTITTDFLTDSAEQTLARIRWFIALETRPRTLNEAYYSDYHARFLSHYKGWRPIEAEADDDNPRASLTSRLRDHSLEDFQESVNEVLAGLTSMGIHGTKSGDLAKLLPPDPYDPAVEIMASVRAYFQGTFMSNTRAIPHVLIVVCVRLPLVVAHKRFIDNIPNTIDYELVLGLDREQALDKALRKGLGIGGADAVAHCAEYIKEPRHVAERREELMKKRERLEMARRQLTEAWL